jgi:cystathionine beta-lyase/cystathionine gamma-synthase
MPEPLYGVPHAHGPLLGPLSPPLVRSTTAGQPDSETLRAMGAGERAGEFYQRIGHQNGRAWESLVAAHEGADGAVAFASGMAAISGALLAHLRPGDRVLLAEEIYGGTSGFALADLVRFGIAVERFSALDLAGLRAALAKGRPAKFVVFESPINPTLRVVDVAAVATAARAAGALTLFDGTFAPPPVQCALALGVDLVVHSATKFYGGHSDVLAGVVAGRHELLGPIEGWRRRTGAMLAPDAAWLLLRSWPTLMLRLQAQQAAALALAQGLTDDVRAGRLVAVSHPGLEGHPDHALARRQMQGGGCVVAVELPGGLPGARRVFDRLQRIARAPSLGGVESLATLPAFTTHAALTPEQRRAAGIADGLLRIAVGLEGADVLLADVRQALAGPAASPR